MRLNTLPVLFPICIAASCSGGSPSPSNISIDGPGASLPENIQNSQLNSVEPVPRVSLAELVRQRNQELGGCATCREGETFAVNEQQVDHGQYTYVTAPTCQNSAEMQQELGRAIDAAGNAAAGNYAGAAEALIDTQAFRQFASENVRGTLGQILNRGRSDTANCRAICVVVPAEAIITGYRTEAANEAGDFQGCSAGQDCSIGWSKWVSEPASSGGQSRTMCGTFANWSDSGHRRARLTVIFRPAEGWVPPR